MNNIFFKVKSKQSNLEARYDKLQARIGTTLAFNANLVKLLTFVILFSDDGIEKDPTVDPLEANRVKNVQDNMIRMMHRYLYAKYPYGVAETLSKGIMCCVGDLREMIWIKKQRALAMPMS